MEACYQRDMDVTCPCSPHLLLHTITTSLLPPEGPWRLEDAMVSHKVSVEDTSLVLASNPMPWQWQPDVSSEKWILRLTNHFQVELLEPQSCFSRCPEAICLTFLWKCTWTGFSSTVTALSQKTGFDLESVPNTSCLEMLRTNRGLMAKSNLTEEWRRPRSTR